MTTPPPLYQFYPLDAPSHHSSGESSFPSDAAARADSPLAGGTYTTHTGAEPHIHHSHSHFAHASSSTSSAPAAQHSPPKPQYTHTHPHNQSHTHYSTNLPYGSNSMAQSMPEEWTTKTPRVVDRVEHAVGRVLPKGLHWHGKGDGRNESGQVAGQGQREKYEEGSWSGGVELESKEEGFGGIGMRPVV